MKVFAEHHGDRFSAFNVDTIEFTATLPPNSLGLSVYSPPFSALYVYSASERDMGNVASHKEFAEQYRHLARSLLAATKPGRVVCVHCSDITTTKVQHGKIGLYDLPSLLRQVHEDEGWIYGSRVTLEGDDDISDLPGRVSIWKDPVVEMQRTKAHGLLYKTFRTDASRCRTGMPDYLLVFRKPVDGPTDATPDPVVHDPKRYPVEWWQEAASPIWRSINQTNVLNNRPAKEQGDERHVAPLQLDFIERCVALYSNPDDVVYSPFMGIGSEGYMAIKAGRRFIGTELKANYFRQAVRNLTDAETAGGDLLAGAVA
jgi:hypothetical protein